MDPGVHGRGPDHPLTARQRNGRRRMIGWTAVALGLGGLLSAVMVAPADEVQGDAARLMYLHVPAAWTAYVAFLVVFAAGAGYLRQRNLRWTSYGRIAAQLGVAATILTIATGSVWGQLVWGVWWAWDPRLVSTALLLLVYVAYLSVQSLGADRHQAAARSAVLGIAGCALIPVVHFSVVWWRSLHQEATVLGAERTPPMDPLMLVTLLLCVAAFLTVATWIFLVRTSSTRQADRDAVPEVVRR